MIRKEFRSWRFVSTIVKHAAHMSPSLGRPDYADFRLCCFLSLSANNGQKYIKENPLFISIHYKYRPTCPHNADGCPNYPGPRRDNRGLSNVDTWQCGGIEFSTEASNKAELNQAIQ